MLAFLRNLFALTRPYRVRLYLGVAAGVIAGLMEPIMVATVVFVYGVIFPSADAPAVSDQLRVVPTALRDWILAGRDSLVSGIQHRSWAAVGLVGLLPAVLLLRGLFSYLNIYFLHWSAVRAVSDLRVRLFSHLMGLSAAFFSQSRTGELMSRITNDTAALQHIISNTISSMVKDPVTLVCMMGYLLCIQAKLTLISLVVLPVCMLPILIYSRKVRRASRELQRHAGELSQVMAEAFTGHRIVKAYNLERVVADQFLNAARQFIGHYMRTVRASEIPGPLMEFAGAAGVALLFLYLLWWGGGRPASTDFLTVILAIFSMYRPMKNLTRLHIQLEQARAASARVFELLAEQSSVPEPADPKPLRAAGAEIHFDRVTFAYGEKVVLRDIDLRIRPGQVVAVVGPSGSGKSTMANLLLRFYDPQQGAIRIGGLDLREVAGRELREQIAVVTQETILFNETVRRNIEMGRPGAGEADILAAARHAFAHDFVMEKPQGYDTRIGEKGVALSGGQRQRLAIARALLKNAPILILDEATSSLDTESEREVQAALEELMKGRTTVCIAHRLSTIQKADLIVVLSEGKIVEMGRHAELVKAEGPYRRLYELQFRD